MSIPDHIHIIIKVEDYQFELVLKGRDLAEVGAELELCCEERNYTVGPGELHHTYNKHVYNCSQHSDRHDEKPLRNKGSGS